MDSWELAYETARKASDGFKAPLGPLYRGHSEESWKLLPGLARAGPRACQNFGFGEMRVLEENLYFEFLTRAGDLLAKDSDSWNTVFAMQHHGIPTRLLDWSETFAVAVYFALKNSKGEAAIWILNPFELNRLLLKRNQLLAPTDLDGNYEEMFVSGSKRLSASAVAISPLRHNPRILRQKAAFTLHNDLNTPLDQLCSSALTKVLLPPEAHDGATDFLRASGFSEFALFPDLDGLTRELNEYYFHC